MKLPMRSWSKLLGQLAPNTRRRRRAGKKHRTHHFQSLEQRVLMTVTVIESGTTWYNDTAGSGPVDDFGETTMGSPVQQTFTINNSSASIVDLYGPPSLPDGFSVVGTYPTEVPAEGSATFAVQMNADSVGSLSGDLSFS